MTPDLPSRNQLGSALAHLFQLLAQTHIEVGALRAVIQAKGVVTPQEVEQVRAQMAQSPGYQELLLEIQKILEAIGVDLSDCFLI